MGDDELMRKNEELCTPRVVSESLEGAIF